MARKTRLVMIGVPDEKVAKLEKFLKNLKKKSKIVRIVKSKSETSEISKAQTKKHKFNQYEVEVCGSDEETEKFISSLFKNNLIPEGKRWTVRQIPQNLNK